LLFSKVNDGFPFEYYSGVNDVSPFILIGSVDSELRVVDNPKEGSELLSGDKWKGEWIGSRESKGRFSTRSGRLDDGLPVFGVLVEEVSVYTEDYAFDWKVCISSRDICT
jgi:hypothetical protein